MLVSTIKKDKTLCFVFIGFDVIVNNKKLIILNVPPFLNSDSLLSNCACGTCAVCVQGRCCVPSALQGEVSSPASPTAVSGTSSWPLPAGVAGRLHPPPPHAAEKYGVLFFNYMIEQI